MIQRLLAIPLFFIIFLVVQQPAMAKDKSYTMVCRGGGSMAAVFERRIRFDKPDQYVTTIQFTKAPKAAGQQAPGPGQCAWLDRPLSTSEPSVLIFSRQGKNPIWKLDFSSGNIALKSADREEFGLLKAVHMAEQVIIKARRDGQTFKITSVGP